LQEKLPDLLGDVGRIRSSSELKQNIKAFGLFSSSYWFVAGAGIMRVSGLAPADNLNWLRRRRAQTARKVSGAMHQADCVEHFVVCAVKNQKVSNPVFPL
jgi:hypothetical protein